MIRVRTRVAWSCSGQDMWNASATQEKARSRSASGRPGGGTVKCTRMKSRPSGVSPYCWLARMFPECWTRKLDTAYTIPGLSGQDSVRTTSRPGPMPIAVHPDVALYATNFSICNNDASPRLHRSSKLPSAEIVCRNRALNEVTAHDDGRRAYCCAMGNSGGEIGVTGEGAGAGGGDAGAGPAGERAASILEVPAPAVADGGTAVGRAASVS